MTANQIDLTSNEMDNLSISNNNNNSNNDSKPSSSSQSHPNLQQLNEKKNDDTNNNNNNVDDNNNNNSNNNDSSNNASYTGLAYTYASSAVSGAYSYAASFYPGQTATAPPSQQSHPQSPLTPQLIQDQQQQQQQRGHSQSLSAIEINKKQQQQQNGKHLKNGKNGKNKNKAVPIVNTAQLKQQQLLQRQQATYDTSKPDPTKYPESNNPSDAINSNLRHLMSSIESNGINVAWTKNFTQPSADTVPLRSLTYKIDGKKQISAGPVFKLVHAQAFKTDIQIDHIAMHPSSWYNQNIALDDMSCFTIIVHLQVKSIKTSFITYHVLDRASMDGYNSNGTPIIKDDKSVTKLLDLILNCNDKTIRNNRLKLIPRIVEGPYPVKRVVENRPVLLGNKVSQSYYRGSNYFEIDSRVDESMVAASIIKLCHRFAKRIVVDMAWTIQGEELDELPERLLCGCTIHNMDFNKCKDLKYEMQNCPKLIYNNNDSQNKDDIKQDK